MNLNENEQWYVRAAVHRGIAAVEQQIEDVQRMIDSVTEDTPARGTILAGCRNMKAYNEQMLREMKQYIPEEFIPG